MTLPTLAEIESLHRKYAPTSEVYELVYTHCQIIERIAEQLTAGRNLKIDRELVRVGCLLHDIGVYALYDTEGNYVAPTGHYITHGLEGERILKAEGYSEVLWRFASHHTGVGLSREEIVRENLPLPHEDFMAATTEERLVMYADKFHSKSQPPHFNSFDAYRQKAGQFGYGNVGAFDRLADEFGIPQLELLGAYFGHGIDTKENLTLSGAGLI